MFCERIQEIRQNANMSQEAFAEKLGVSRQSVSKWETGQSYPETDKLIEICDAFDVSLDELMRGKDTNTSLSNRSLRPYVLTACAAILIALSIIILFISFKRPEQNYAETALPADISDLSDWFFDFSRANRFDYVPYFEEGSAPVDSPEYLYFAFAVNLENWGDSKGTMSRKYIDDIANEYFGVVSLNHLSLPRGWDFDGENYTALPGSISEKPLCRLVRYTTYLKNGIQYHDAVLDFCALTNGNIPEENDIEAFKSGASADFYVVSSERFVFTRNYFGKPVFVSHTAEE